MDPDAALAKLRELLDGATVDAKSDDELWEIVHEAVDVFAGLDNWISKGGYLPKEWQR